MATMASGDFRHNERSVTLADATVARIEHVAADGTQTVLKSVPLEAGEVLDGTMMSKRALVSFLEELLFIADSEKVAYDGYLLSLQDGSLLARLEGGSILSRTKEIKAVTYHRLKIIENKRGLKTSIVFDV